MIYLDTHVVAWFFAGKIDLIPEKIKVEMAKEELLISPVVLLELQYLFEIGRVTKKGLNVVQGLEKRIGLNICELPFEDVVNYALGQIWTHDHFDRMIVVQANVKQSKLVTKDITIRKNYKHSLWD